MKKGKDQSTKSQRTIWPNIPFKQPVKALTEELAGNIILASLMRSADAHKSKVMKCPTSTEEIQLGDQKDIIAAVQVLVRTQFCVFNRAA